MASDYEQRASEYGVKYTSLGSKEDSRLLLSSENAWRGTSDEPVIDPYSESIARAIREYDSTKKAGTDVGIYRSVNPASRYTNAQSTIDAYKNLKAGDTLWMFDIENVGTYIKPGKTPTPGQMSYYSPTELAFKKYQVTGRGLLKATSEADEISLLIRPTQNVYAQLDQLVKNMEVSMLSGKHMSLSEDQRRTLNDLILYSDDDPLKSGVFKQENGVTMLNRQMRKKQAPDNFLFNPEQVRLIRKGLDNLEKYGTTPDKVAIKLDQMFQLEKNTGAKQGLRLGGYNIDAFDIPMLRDYMNVLGEQINLTSSPTAKKAIDRLQRATSNIQSLDLYQAFRVLYKDPFKVFGKTTKVQDIAAKYNLHSLVNKNREGGGLIAHQALDDVKLTASIHNFFTRKFGLVDAFQEKSSKRSRSNFLATWDDTSLKVGDQLFAMGGLAPFEVGKHDQVFREVNVGGKKTKKALERVYGNNVSPISKNTIYTLENVVENFDINGVGHAAAWLKNQDTGMYHFIARREMSELQNIFHNTMLPYNLVSEIPEAQDFSATDKARRRYLRYFDGSGNAEQLRRLYRGADAYIEGIKKGLAGEELETSVRSAAKYLYNGEYQNASPEFFRDLKVLIGKGDPTKSRLMQERPYVEDFLSQIENKYVTQNGRPNAGAQGIALRNFKRLMDEEFGANTAPKILGAGQRVLPLDVDGQKEYISLSNRSKIESSVRRVVNSGYTKTPALPVIKERLRMMLDASRDGEYKGIASTSSKEIKNAIESLQPGDEDKIANIISLLANRIEQAKQHNADLGINTIDVEDPTRMTADRLTKMRKTTKEKGTEIMAKAISATDPFLNRNFVDGNLQISDPFLKQVLQTHNKTLSSMASTAGLSNLGRITAEESLSKLLKSIDATDLAYGIYYEGVGRGLVLALADKKHANVFKGTNPQDIINNNNVAAIKLASLDQDGNIRLRGQKRQATLKLFGTGDTGYRLGTGIEDVFSSLSKGIYGIQDLIKNGRAIDAESRLNARVRRALENTSINNQRMNSSDLNDLRRFDIRKSNQARWLRSGQLDVTALAESWYRSRAESPQGLEQMTSRRLAQIQQRVKNYEVGSFFEGMSSQEMKYFLQDVGDYAKQNLKINLNLHNVKDTRAAQGFLSTEDVTVQALRPFGYYNTMSRENLMKSVNFYPLAESTSEMEEKLRSRGFSDRQISNMINMGLVTDLEDTVNDGQVPWINTRAAHMDAQELVQRQIDVFGESNGRLNTYDGGIVVSKSTARALGIERQRGVKITEGASLHPSIQKAIDDARKAGLVDADGNIMLEKPVNLVELVGGRNKAVGSAKYGMITVGQTVRDGIAQGTDFIKTHNNQVYLTGYNKEANKLIYEERRELSNSDKTLTDAGGRFTVQIESDEWFQKMNLGDVGMVIPSTDVKKAQHGSIIASQVRLVIDETKNKVMNQLEGKMTVQDMMRSPEMRQAMGEVAGLMKEHLGVGEAVNIENDRLTIQNVFGLASDKETAISPDQLTSFLKASVDRLGLNKDIVLSNRGQYGLGVADLDNWERDLGMVAEPQYDKNGRLIRGINPNTGKFVGDVQANAEGLVRWSVKEEDAINFRLARYGEGTVATRSWVSKHMERVAQAQNNGIYDFTRNVVSATLDSVSADVQSGNFGPGEIVIRTTGTSFSDEARGIDDIPGRNHGRSVRGRNGTYYEVSANAFHRVPDINKKNGNRTVQDYNKSVVDMASVDDLHIPKLEGEGKYAFANLFRAKGREYGTSSTALFELSAPDMAGLNRKYVRFINTDKINQVGIGKDALAVLDEIQRSQLRIYELTMDKSDSATINRAVDQYEKQLTRFLTASRDGTAYDKALSAKLDMSGQFRGQGINPFHQGSYQEGTAYVSRTRMQNMIRGAETHIAKNVYGLDVSKMSTNEISEKVLDLASTKGLYGFVNRYPTINEATNQVLRVQVDPNLKDTDRGAYLSVGTATKLKLDYDGDFMSIVLAQYKDGNAGQIHQELQGVYAEEVKHFETVGKAVLQDITKKADELGMSNMDYWSQYKKEWLPKVGSLYDTESTIARLGKGDVGPLDNLRLKLINASGSAFDVLQDAGINGYQVADRLGKNYRIEEFGRLLSQNAISSKKFSAEQLDISLRKKFGDQVDSFSADRIAKETRVLERERDAAITTMKDVVYNPSQERAYQKFLEANDIVGAFMTDEQYEADLAQGRNPASTWDQRYKLGEMFDSLQELHGLYGREKDWMRDPSLNFGMSEGYPDIEKLVRFLEGQSGNITPTPTLRRLAKVDERIDALVNGNMERYRSMVLKNYDRMTGSSLSYEGVLGEKTSQLFDTMLSGTKGSIGTTAPTFSEVAGKFMQGASFGGMAGGAALFAGLWGASALVRSGPTPESMEETMASAPPVTPQMMGAPTARVTPMGEGININISAEDAQGMTPDEINALVQNELNSMMNTSLSMNTSVNDNTQNIDQQWLQGVVANAINKGFAF